MPGLWEDKDGGSAEGWRRGAPPHQAELSLLFLIPSSGLPTSASDNALSRMRSFSNGTSGSGSSQQDSPQIKASPSFTFSCSRPSAPAAASQSPQKGSSRAPAPGRGKLGWGPLVRLIQYLSSCCAKPQP